jgi:hypothetical protein
MKKFIKIAFVIIAIALIIFSVIVLYFINAGGKSILISLFTASIATSSAIAAEEVK